MQLHLEELTDRILFVEIESRRDLGNAFMRVQEHHESPVFKGRIFTFKNYWAWWALCGPGELYWKYWKAFNLPAQAFKPFYEGKFKPHIKSEQTLLNVLKPWVDDGFYVVATSSEGDHHDVRHELAHALYATNSSYRREVRQVLEEELHPRCRRDIEAYLKKTAGYHPSTWDDEVHAYILAGQQELRAEGGIRVTWFRQVSKKLEGIFNKYCPESARKLIK